MGFICDFVGGVGDISQDEFNNKVSPLKLRGKVFYLGKKNNEDKIYIFSKSDIFVLPTFYDNECFPLFLLEAMQYSLPLLNKEKGSIPDIVNNSETGFIVYKKKSRKASKKK